SMRLQCNRKANLKAKGKGEPNVTNIPSGRSVLIGTGFGREQVDVESAAQIRFWRAHIRDCEAGMKRALTWISAAVVVGALSVPATLVSQAKQEPPKPAEMKLKVGDMAPDFTLLAFDGTKVTPVSLHDYKGKKNVAL